MGKRRAKKIGLWLVGACGGIGSTVAMGLALLTRKQVATTGLVTALPAFEGLNLPDPADIVLGGHEVRRQSLVDSVREMHHRARLFDEQSIRVALPYLRKAQRNIRTGTAFGANGVIRALAEDEAATRDRTAASAIARIADDLRAFRQDHRLGQVVVVYVGPSEPPSETAAVHQNFDRLSKALAKDRGGLLAVSSVYALAAIEARCSFINFTPSTGLNLPAIRQRADDLGILYMGKDGKTGETLVKSVLAPLFALRNLNILSWVGHNLLGNRDGAVLADPSTKAAKIKSKDHAIQRIVGYPVDTHVSIEYLKSLDDWKLAWDFIHFEGFLGARMSMQFVWHGSDSILAAPLVIDLARLTAFEAARGGRGPMPHLACFFKSPLDVKQHDYATQWRMLLDYIAACRQGVGTR